MSKPAFNTVPTKFKIRSAEIDKAYQDFISGMYTSKQIADKYGWKESDTSRYLSYKLSQNNVKS